MIFQFLFFAKIDILPNSSPTFGVDPEQQHEQEHEMFYFLFSEFGYAGLCNPFGITKRYK